MISTPSPSADNAIPNQYVVVFHQHATTENCEDHCNWAQDKHSTRISTLSMEEGETCPYDGVKHYFKFPHENETNGWFGYSGTFDAHTVDEIAARDEVAFVEPDYKVYAKNIVSEKSVPWGLARISQRSKLPARLAGDVTNNVYTFDNSAGEGVTAYVIDTGILADHDDFEDRAVFGHNTVVGSSNTDKNGHGTHVSGTIGGKTYGVAKKVKIVGVKVLGDDGSGSNSTVIAGLNWAAEQAAAKGNIKKSVANMSLGGSKSKAMNLAVAAIIAQGMTVCVAAGNESEDASNASPASEPTAITVGAINIADDMSYFSNFGKLVDIFAPGRDITSTWIDTTGEGRTDLTNTISGTSMATPHVAGLSAYLIALEGLDSPKKVRDRLVNLASKGQITGLPADTSNILAFNGVKANSKEEEI